MVDLMFTECADAAMDHRLGRVPDTLYYDARYPTRTQQYSARELRLILSQLHRPSVLRGQHFYPFDSDPNYAQWFNHARHTETCDLLFAHGGTLLYGLSFHTLL